MKYLLAFLLLTAQAFAGTVCVQTERGKGSAAVIDKTPAGYWVALTAEHVVRDAEGEDVSLYLGEKWVPAHNVYHLEPGIDAAFITFKYDAEKMTTWPLGDDAEISAAVSFAGFPQGEKYLAMKGTVREFDKFGRGWASTTREPIPGQSGGPVFDARNHLVGILTNRSDGIGRDQFNRIVSNVGPQMVFEPIGKIRAACIKKYGVEWGTNPVAQKTVAADCACGCGKPGCRCGCRRGGVGLGIGIGGPGGGIGAGIGVGGWQRHCPIPKPSPKDESAPPPPTEKHCPTPQTPNSTPVPDDSLNARLDRLESLLATMQLKDGKDGVPGLKGDRGEPGPQGPAGKDGAAGRPGKDADPAKLDRMTALMVEIVQEVNLLKQRPASGGVSAEEFAELKAELERLRYTQIPVKILNQDGSVYDVAKVRLDKRIPPDDPRLRNSADMNIKLTPKADEPKDVSSAGSN